MSRSAGSVVNLEVVVITVRVILNVKGSEGHGDDLPGGGCDPPGTAYTVRIGGACLLGIP